MKRTGITYKILTFMLVQALFLSSVCQGSFAINLSAGEDSVQGMLSPHINVQNMEFQQVFDRSAEFSISFGAFPSANKWMTVAFIGGIAAISLMGDPANQTTTAIVDSYQTNPDALNLFAMSMLPGYRGYNDLRKNTRIWQQINRSRTKSRSSSWTGKTIAAFIIAATILVHGFVIKTIDTIFSAKKSSLAVVQSLSEGDITQRQQGDSMLALAIEKIRQKQKADALQSGGKDNSLLRITPQNVKKQVVTVKQDASKPDKYMLPPELVKENVEKLFERKDTAKIYGDIFEILRPTGFPISILPAINLAETDGKDKSLSNKDARGPMQVTKSTVNGLNNWLKNKKNKGARRQIIEALVGKDPIKWNKLDDPAYGRRIGAAAAYLKWAHLTYNFNNKGLAYNQKTNKWELVNLDSEREYKRLKDVTSALLVDYNFGHKIYDIIEEYGVDSKDWRKGLPEETNGYHIRVWRYYLYISRYLIDNPNIKAQMKVDVFASLMNSNVNEISKPEQANSLLLGIGFIVVPFSRRYFLGADPSLIGQAI